MLWWVWVLVGWIAVSLVVGITFGKVAIGGQLDERSKPR
jgi:hypothetical protein